MAKKQVTITIPMSLATLLVAEPEDVKDGQYEQMQAVAKSLLKLLIAAE